MTKEQLQAFAEGVSKSEELQKQYILIQVESARSNAEKLAKLSQRTDTAFTAEEYLQLAADSADEMSSEQLHAVAGGVWQPTFNNIAMSILGAGIMCGVRAIFSAIGTGDADKCQFG
ncbi:MAG TPA: hypothetical protein VN939_23850 [Chthoniobacterales bacterium]|nr:hypothetical protein [Chthoniobacterales bacterium]